MDAIQLEEGNLLVTEDGAAEITQIRKYWQEEPVETYNFHVEDWCSYFVSEQCVYVHNSNDKHETITQIFQKAKGNGKLPKGDVKPKKEIGSDTGYQLNKDTDVDLRGEGDYKDALDITFERTGESHDNFEVTQWGKIRMSMENLFQWNTNQKLHMLKLV